MDRFSCGRSWRPQRGQDLMEEAGREREYIDERLFALVRPGLEIKDVNCTAFNPCGLIRQALKPNLEFGCMHNPIQRVSKYRDLGHATCR